MNQATSKNLLLVLGVWTLSRLIALAFRLTLFNLINHGQTWTGDAGNVAMWIWLSLPEVLVSAVAPILLIWVLETKKPLAWLGGLGALYLYDGGLHAWRLLTHGWRTPPGTADYVGILTGAVLPALASLAVGAWWARRTAVQKPVAA